MRVTCTNHHPQGGVFVRFTHYTNNPMLPHTCVLLHSTTTVSSQGTIVDDQSLHTQYYPVTIHRTVAHCVLC